MKIIACEQGSNEWRWARTGKVTASGAGKIITPTGQRVSGEKWEKYIDRLAAEIVAGRPFDDEDYQSRAMLNGIEREPLAAEQFARAFGVKLKKTGFHLTDDERIGASLDRIIEGTDDREALEIKCPQADTQARYMRMDNIFAFDRDYYQQIQTQMYVANLRAVHFYTYHPALPARRVVTLRDDDFIDKLIRVLDHFIAELDLAVEKIHERTLFSESAA